jgi:hypothetical protein
MKTTVLLAIFGAMAAFSTPARAGNHELRFDPSGAPMCFTSDGEKALLARCQSGPRAQLATVLDPSGAPMCFTETEAKAPLRACPPHALAGAVVSSAR